MSRAKDNYAVEAFMRTVTTEMGSSAALVPAPMTVAETRDYGVRRTLSQAWGIGRAIAMCRQKKCVALIPPQPQADLILIIWLDQ